MAFARLNGAVVHYEDAGARNGRTIVFSNSLGTDFRIWDGLLGHLPANLRIIRYDTRGHGLSEATPAPYAMKTLAEDLAALLDHLRVKGAAVVGLSVGGMIAQGLASLRPDLVSALVLMDTAHRIGTVEGWNGRIDTVRQKGMAAIADGVLGGWFTQGYRDGVVDFAGYRAMLLRNDIEGYAGVCAALRDADLTESTRALKVPTLCAAGEHDATTSPAIMRGTADLIDGARLEVVRDAGHIPCVERPKEVAGLIGGFLNGLDG
ncbi:MAG: 3-oxoadipate enol-lactonase [Hyphomicrobiales bacterium]|nr:3-oxoadipate enol-lactonase [Hyphomicrobiales bacterium]